MLDKILKLSKSKDSKIKPKHIAISIGGIIKWAEKEKKTLNEALNIAFKNIYQLFVYQVESNIPIMTIYLNINRLTNSDSELSQSLVKFLNDIRNDDFIQKSKVKISVLGKWYDLPGELVESIRGVIDETKDYDSFFFNFCLNYDGQEEIVDACKLIARRVQANKISPVDINKGMIKENVYSSYYLPPDLIIITGNKFVTGGILLWDSVNAKINFVNVLWPNFKKEDFNKSLTFFEDR